MKQLGAFTITLLAGFFWALSGVAAQVLFERYAFPPLTLIMLRSLIAGAILLLWLRPRWPIKDTKPMLLFAIFGVLPSQVFYLLAINYSNVVTALLLQYLFLPIVVVYEVFAGRFRMTKVRFASIAVALFGLVLLTLGGSSGIKLSVTPLALISGVICAFGVAYYTLSAKPLTKKYGSWPISAWGFLIVGLAATPLGLYQFNSHAIAVSQSNFPIIAALVAVVAIAGTVLGYGLFLLGLNKLASTEAAVASSTEPIFAAIISFFIFGALLTGIQYFGGALMIIAVIVLRSVSDVQKLSKK